MSSSFRPVPIVNNGLELDRSIGLELDTFDGLGGHPPFVLLDVRPA